MKFFSFRPPATFQKKPGTEMDRLDGYGGTTADQSFLG